MPRAALLLLLLSLSSTSALADEGQWPPGMLQRLDPARLRAMGLERPVSDLWSETGGLARAAVNFGGCTGAFISEDGLFATNHHCAYGALQAASSVEHDYLKDGFVAETPADELPAKGRSTIWVLERIEDVTALVREAAAASPDDAHRKADVEAAKLARATACEAEQEGLRCEVVAAFFGARYEQHVYREIEDVRLVFAPPSSVGEFGGEVDNWMWPRHSGDFSLLRAYVAKNGTSAEHSPDNVPFHPKHRLEVGAEGVAPGDFVAILGYPGRTRRYLWAQALEHHVEVELPAIVDLYGEWLGILRDAKKTSRAVAIKVAALEKGLANRHKNARGMLAGIQRMGLLERRKAEAQAMLQEVKKAKDLEGAQTLGELARMTSAGEKAFAKNLLLDNLARGPRLLWVATELLRVAKARALPDAERRPAYQDRNLPKLKKGILRAVADYDEGVEARLLGAWLKRALDLDRGQAFPRLRQLGPLLELPPAQMAKAMLSASLVHDADKVEAAFDHAVPAKLEGLPDGVIRLARLIAPELEARDRARDVREGALIRLAPDYLRVLERARGGGPLYPDANGTLRISVAQVMGYQPQDGLQALPNTTLQGQVAKHTGAPPFELPELVRSAAGAAKASYFADPVLEDVPVCFLGNGDTTGGNSGSPIIDGRGRWVGLNFDRVWENIAGDVAYNPPQSRNISVDVRYVLWLLSVTPGTQRITDELGTTTLAAKPRRAAKARPGASAATETTSAKSKSNCTCTRPAGALGGGLLGLGLLGALVARRRRPIP